MLTIVMIGNMPIQAHLGFLVFVAFICILLAPVSTRNVKITFGPRG